MIMFMEVLLLLIEVVFLKHQGVLMSYCMLLSEAALSRGVTNHEAHRVSF